MDATASSAGAHVPPEALAAFGPVLFYDGECGLCARSVRWCLRHDRKGILRFAPLQGVTYRALAAPHKPTDVSTMALLDEHGLHTDSDAWARTLRALGGPWAAVGGAARAAPRPIRDAAYRFIARRRRRLFGKADACPVASDDHRQRMLP